jgi:hypothetical protein
LDAHVDVTLHIADMDQAARDKLVTELAEKLDGNWCILCNKKFPSKHDVEVHFWDHTDERFELECLICGASFFVKEHLTEHIVGHIQEAKEYRSPESPVFKLSKSFTQSVLI